MGMFDEVSFDCTRCGSKITGQSKGGECKLRQYDIADAPIEVLVDLDYLECNNCGQDHKVNIQHIAQVVPTGVEFE